MRNHPIAYNPLKVPLAAFRPNWTFSWVNGCCPAQKSAQALKKCPNARIQSIWPHWSFLQQLGLSGEQEMT